ncbi:MAG: ABC transporter ATP-binding protein [Rhizobiaceae bacterium]|nr:ABC transporter ATP-binding protein [Rhizobiaceae bacterium]
MTSTEPIVSVRNVSKYYDDNCVLERLSLDVESGSICTIVGASGCGKSTFLRMLLSQERPSRGSLLVDGKPIAAEPTPDRGIVFQRYSVFSHLTVEENLLLVREVETAPMAARLFGVARRQALEDIEETLEKIGLTGARKQFPSQLSGGMQQRLAIAQTLLKRPKILLLDEPFGALDPGIRSDMHELLKGIWQENLMTVFMVTHDISEAFKLGTRLLVFDKRRYDPHDSSAYGATVTYDLDLYKQQSTANLPAIESIVGGHRAVEKGKKP